jgi:hypothetical protein
MRSNLEKRGHVRYDCAGIAEISVAGDQPKIVGAIIEISMVGCLLAVQSCESLEKGSLVDLKCEIEGRSFRALGRTQSVRSPSRLGIRFAGVDILGQHQLQALLNDLAGRRSRKKETPKILAVKQKHQA